MVCRNKIERGSSSSSDDQQSQSRSWKTQNISRRRIGSSVYIGLEQSCSQGSSQGQRKDSPHCTTQVMVTATPTEKLPFLPVHGSHRRHCLTMTQAINIPTCTCSTALIALSEMALASTAGPLHPNITCSAQALHKVVDTLCHVCSSITPGGCVMAQRRLAADQGIDTAR
jgi:hypothetical protein